MPKLNQSRIIEACILNFNGVTDEEIRILLNVNKVTISRWRKLPLWEAAEKRLIKKTVDDKFNKKIMEE